MTGKEKEGRIVDAYGTMETGTGGSRKEEARADSAAGIEFLADGDGKAGAGRKEERARRQAESGRAVGKRGRRKRHAGGRRRFRRAAATAAWLAALAVAAAILFGLVLGVARAGDNSMYPAISAGDIVFFSRLREPSAGDVVVYRADGKARLGRVVAVEGDTVDVTDGGGLVINGIEAEEEGIFYSTFAVTGGTEFPVEVGEGGLFVLGDHRTAAEDSRTFGTVILEDVEGTAVAVIRGSF